MLFIKMMKNITNSNCIEYFKVILLFMVYQNAFIQTIPYILCSKILLPNGNSYTSHSAQDALNQMVSLNNGSNSEKHHEKSKTIKNELSNGFSMPKSNHTGQSLTVTSRDPIQ